MKPLAIQAIEKAHEILLANSRPYALRHDLDERIGCSTLFNPKDEKNVLLCAIICAVQELHDEKVNLKQQLKEEFADLKSEIGYLRAAIREKA